MNAADWARLLLERDGVQGREALIESRRSKARTRTREIWVARDER